MLIIYKADAVILAVDAPLSSTAVRNSFLTTES